MTPVESLDDARRALTDAGFTVRVRPAYTIARYETADAYVSVSLGHQPRDLSSVTLQRGDDETTVIPWHLQGTPDIWAATTRRAIAMAHEITEAR